MRAICMRAFKAAHSTHVILRFRFNHLKASIIADTFPKVMRLCFPTVPYTWNKSDWYVEFPNGARIWFGGLDDKERAEKILGQEHSTILFNECSQIPYPSVTKALTRLAQNVGLRLLAIFDENPPTMAHWSYKVFVLKQDPDTKKPLGDPDDYGMIYMNPGDNLDNLSPRYLKLLGSLPEKEQRRFLRGEFGSSTPNALWTEDSIAKMRAPMRSRSEFQEIVVAVDPSGCHGLEDKRSDEIGIVVVGKRADGGCSVLEDATERNHPSGWAKTALGLFDKWAADRIVAEQNFGGDMVRAVIQGERRTAPVKLVTASRGKTQRAEPVAALCGRGMVELCDDFPEMETQLCEFTSAAYQGQRSPDRADAMIWGVSDLMQIVPGEGLIEFYERLAAEKPPEAPTDGVVEWNLSNPTAAHGRIKLRKDKAPSVIYGSRGDKYMPDAQGVINVSPDDLSACLLMGFVKVQ